MAPTGIADAGSPTSTARRVFRIYRSRRTIGVDLIRSMRPYVVELGLASETELDELFTEALAHPDNPEVVMMPNLNFLVSGRKPDTI